MLHLRLMALTLRLQRYALQFDFEARTSRGIMRDRTVWFLWAHDTTDPARQGVGECAPLPGLSPELTPAFEGQLAAHVERLNAQKLPMPAAEDIEGFIERHAGSAEAVGSSVLFALEMALRDWQHGGQRLVFPGPFASGAPIPINGLIWMGGLDFMLQQIEIKIRQGFRCIKLKVGGLDFEKECDVLQYVRRKYFRENIVIRLDANGAFKPDEALYKLKELSRFDIHSIEQPLKTGAAELPDLCAQSPIPVALDEELIGVHQRAKKEELLKRIRPQFVILKPSLHGGFSGTAEWIALAQQHGAGWWVTSALESSLGLNAIAQFTSQYPLAIPQGLGTGMIYSNNIESPLEVERGVLRVGTSPWDLAELTERPEE